MRKTKLTYEMVDRAVALKKDGLCDADIIAALGVHQSTFYRWLKEPDTKVKRALCEGLKKAESEYKRSLLVTIRNAAMSRAQYWTAAAWLLERKYPMEFGRMERKSDEGKDEPVQLTLGLELEVMTDDDDGGGTAASDGTVADGGYQG